MAAKMRTIQMICEVRAPVGMSPAAVRREVANCIHGDHFGDHGEVEWTFRPKFKGGWIKREPSAVTAPGAPR